MRLFELNPNNPIDRELNKASKDAENDGSLDQDDIDSQDEPMMDEPMDDMGDPSDDSMGGMDADMGSMGDDDAEQDYTPDKPVDGDLMGRMQKHDYVQRYDHSNKQSPFNPANIMGMDMDEISQQRNKVRIFMNQLSMDDKVGSYANPELKAAQDLLSFVDQVMAYKKMEAKEVQTGTKTKRPSVKQHPESNVKPGQKFKHKSQ